MTTPKPASPTRMDWWWLSLLAALTTSRTIAYIVFGPVHFDSDQAVLGIMAIELSELRAIPIVVYGQTYMLGVISWLAAPLFAVFGPSIGLLKAPFVPINVAAVWALYVLLRRDTRLSPAESALASATLAMPTVVLSQSFMNASGGHIEPLLYGSLLFFLRHRPIVLGSFAAFAFAHREVIAGALVALLIVDLCHARDRRTTAMNWIRTGAVFVVLLGTIRWASAAWSTNYGGMTASYAITADLPGGLWWLAKDTAILLGLYRHDLRDVGFSLPYEEGTWVALGAVAVLSVGAAAGWSSTRGNRDRRDELGLYLLLTCVFIAIAFAAREMEQDTLRVRYLFILAFVPAALAALALAHCPNRFVFWSTCGALTSVIIANGIANVGYYRALRNARMPDRLGAVAAVLEAQGYSLGLAPYWMAYNLTFRSGGRIHVASSDVVRIPAYQKEVDRYNEHIFSIDVAPCAPGKQMVVREIKICKP